MDYNAMYERYMETHYDAGYQSDEPTSLFPTFSHYARIIKSKQLHPQRANINRIQTCKIHKRKEKPCDDCGVLDYDKTNQDLNFKTKLQVNRLLTVLRSLKIISSPEEDNKFQEEVTRQEEVKRLKDQAISHPLKTRRIVQQQSLNVTPKVKVPSSVIVEERSPQFLMQKKKVPEAVKLSFSEYTDTRGSSQNTGVAVQFIEDTDMQDVYTEAQITQQAQSENSICNLNSESKVKQTLRIESKVSKQNHSIQRSALRGKNSRQPLDQKCDVETIPYHLNRYSIVITRITLLAIIIFLVLSILFQIKQDLSHKMQSENEVLTLEIQKCTHDYYENKCDPSTRVRALDVYCEEKQRCLSREPRVENRNIKILMQLFAEAINNFFEPLSYKSMVFFIITLCSVLIANEKFGRKPQLPSLAPFNLDNQMKLMK